MYKQYSRELKKVGKVAAVVVTYNRLELLKKVIAGLRCQTYKLDQIFVVNNSSTDSTAEWLAEQADIETITQPNWGSSGGQYTGSKAAFEAEYEWIWQMDDDVVADENCLENLLKHCTPELVCTPKRIKHDGAVCYEHDITKINMSNPFKSLWDIVLSEKDFENNNVIYVDGITFEGPVFHHSVFAKAGFADRNFFIMCDDTEYCLRLMKAGIKMAIIKDALLFRQLPYPANPYAFVWSTYYFIRNLIAIDILHGSSPVRILRPFGYAIAWLFHCRNFADIKCVLKALVDGYFYKSKN